MFDGFILGLVQGIAEWLPISSEGMLVVAQSYLLGNTSVVDMIRVALFLHLGTLLAAIVYFRKDIVVLIKSLFNFRRAEIARRKEIVFLTISTLISGLLGMGLLSLVSSIEDHVLLTGKIATAAVGVLLFITAGLQFAAQKEGQRTSSELTLWDGVLLGFLQGLAALPGLSRSGLTVSGLLLRNMRGEDALRLSFLMSIPIVFAANVVLNFDQAFISLFSLIGLVTAFVFGILTIHALLKLTERINFAHFVLVFAFLMFAAALLS